MKAPNITKGPWRLRKDYSSIIEGASGHAVCQMRGLSHLITEENKTINERAIESLPELIDAALRVVNSNSDFVGTDHEFVDYICPIIQNLKKVLIKSGCTE